MIFRDEVIWSDAYIKATASAVACNPRGRYSATERRNALGAPMLLPQQHER